MNDRPAPPPEGKLIAHAADLSGLSLREAARRAGISYGRWRQIVTGYQNVSSGVTAPVHAPARTVARMAQVAGVTPGQLENEGERPDAAEVLRELIRREPSPASQDAGTSEPPADPDLDHIIAVWPALSGTERHALVTIVDRWLKPDVAYEEQDQRRRA